ncbi:molybdopterin biosynthesis protein CNX1 isoform X1 [Senna tora]|uniref:Molybdopterin biosynthesis protein CNX1 isoform X1 n=1 Tax=Senna tora TaxID=362788 RepID=A0A834TSV8_9FABA|nr:molybdopterin biosynthesis protein CNX1 isoform X1 [Senna tora]
MISLHFIVRDLLEIVADVVEKEEFIQDGYAVVADDGQGEYTVITKSRVGNDGIGVIVTPGTMAYVTTGAAALIKLCSQGELARFIGRRSYIINLETASPSFFLNVFIKPPVIFSCFVLLGHT